MDYSFNFLSYELAQKTLQLCKHIVEKNREKIFNTGEFGFTPIPSEEKFESLHLTAQIQTALTEAENVLTWLQQIQDSYPALHEDAQPIALVAESNVRIFKCILNEKSE